jgi:glycosyltransferase involved in cell wall biosynthesis
MIADEGLEFVEAPAPGKGAPPTLRNISALSRIAQQRGIDLIHAWEWAPTVEAAYGPYLRHGVPVLSTVYDLNVPRFLPGRYPLVVCFPDVAEAQRWRPTVRVIESPVDTAVNAPGDTAEARKRFGVEEGEFAIVIVSRLARLLKREGILAAIEAMELIPPEHRMRLYVVGDGPCRAEVEAATERVNARAGERLVTLTGQLLDPRDAYAAADVVVGMGSSALKGMAFAKPVVVQGEKGYWELLTPQSLPTFLYQNFYGLGDGTDGRPTLVSFLTGLAADPARRAELGAFGRQVVEERFSLDGAARRIEELYHVAVAQGRDGTGTRLRALTSPTGHLALYKAKVLPARTRGFVNWTRRKLRGADA